MIDEGSQIYVLDRINSAVTVFDSTGAIVATFGGDGDGPLEFRLPVAFDLLEDGTLVIEELGGALKTFSRSEAGFDFRARIPIGSFARDMCALDNRVFAESGYPSYEGLLAEYAPEDAGEPLRSFGEGYAYGTELLRMQMNHGSLACLPGPGRVAFGFRAMPRVDLYSAAGKLLWTAGITDYVQGWTVETPQQDAGAAVSTPDFPKEWLVGLRPVAGDHIVAVYRRQMSAMSDREFRTYLIDSATGWGALVGDLLEPVAAIGGSIYVTVPSGPFPRLRVWRMREESTG
ncbi:hypothetical protein [Candidatus Palauibacter sp.]|uniref:hypothetical protein n=1 Tax=Candidatus Palauibacter sp. TaxID=3101350 RepID=UPI003B027EED